MYTHVLGVSVGKKGHKEHANYSEMHKMICLNTMSHRLTDIVCVCVCVCVSQALCTSAPMG